MLFLENYLLKSEYGTRQIGDDVDVDRFVKIPRGIVKVVFVQVDNFVFTVDFSVLDTQPTMHSKNQILVILSQLFLTTSNALIHYKN